MKLSELSKKLTKQQQMEFINHRVWSDANRRQLDWVEAASNLQAVGVAADKLSSHAAMLLTEMIRAFGAEPITEERLIREVRRRTMMSGAECDMAQAELEQAGILFAVVKVWGERICFLPRDCFLAWQQSLFPSEVQQVSSSDMLLSGTVTAMPVNKPLGKQLMDALAVMGQCSMALTSKGVLAKKTVAAIVQKAVFEEQTLMASGLSWSKREHYSLKAAFLLEAAAAFDLVRFDDNMLRWREDRLASWLWQDEEEREWRLLQWCLDLLLPVDAASAHLVSALCALEVGKWYRTEDIRNLQNRWRLDKEAEGKALDWLSLLLAFGWMEAAQATSSGKTTELIRWKLNAYTRKIDAEKGSASSVNYRDRQLRVQQNGEIIVEPGCRLAVHWELALIAELVADETVAIYRLTASSVTRALEFGRTKLSMISWLEQQSGQLPLPETVGVMLEEWTGKACRTWFEEVTLLRCDNKQMADWVRMSSVLAPMLLHEIGSTDFIVDASLVPDIRKLLQRAGYPAQKALRSKETAASYVSASYPVIREAVSGSDTEAEWDEAEVRRTGAYSFLHTPNTLAHFELVSARERLNDQLQSQEQTVPAMWTKQLRVYHHSTRKELIERALAWQSPLQLRMDSELHSFVPERLEQQGGDWAVVGILRNDKATDHMPIRLTPDMWDEMRIVIPGRPYP
ncbi:helicase-associated domain-containing protein [Paenibacillus sp. YIM B09110]|uniref:helicase-associated domain-containing protein n=1 Tax=Paenibacillus sp. YIM B09110 TaxID=3126102 RepID=UPI00301BCDE0